MSGIYRSVDACQLDRNCGYNPGAARGLPSCDRRPPIMGLRRSVRSGEEGGMRRHDENPHVNGGSIGVSLSDAIGEICLPAEKYVPAQSDAPVVVLSDVRNGSRGKAAQNLHRKRTVSGRYRVVDVEQLQLARIVNELAQTLGVDLALVIAVRDGTARAG